MKKDISFHLSFDSLSRDESKGRNVDQVVVTIYWIHDQYLLIPAVFPPLADILPDFIGASLSRGMTAESLGTLAHSSKLEILLS